jgi:anti-sigma regulatory factor (Ser/Thr protein kinase)/putative methionine-R-sulfoxide reductase with GAF domain
MASEPAKQPMNDVLDRIRAVTDAALSDLDVEQLLVELLDRARELLHADTAAVLLLEEASGQLVARAARGIEEEVRQGVRIPIGRGFAGRIAADKQAVVLDKVDHTTVLNPILRERGIKLLLGVPMISEGRVVGVLHVGTLGSRRFTHEDSELLQMVADRIALATQARLSHAERSAAVMLQTSLLPGRLPNLPHVRFAARYVAGEAGGVGGDWYDAFVMPSGSLCVVMGDVVGRGLPAAVVMGRLRSTLRSYAMTTEDPTAILTLVDRKIEHFEPGEMATALVARFDPGFERVQLATAGHPAPVIVGSATEAHFAAVDIDPPLGIGFRGHRRAVTVPLPPDAVVCFYTDGLVERRDRGLDAQLERLRRAVEPDEPERVCATVMQRMVGNETPRDDIALLVVCHADDDEGSFEVDMPAMASSLSGIRSAFRQWLTSVGASSDDMHDLVLAVGEATANAVEHAYGGTGGSVRVQATIDGDDVIVRVRDDGQWREPRGEHRGRGTQIMSRTADDVRVARRDTGTEVVIRKRLDR